MKSGLRPSRFGFFGGGRYASSIGPYPKNKFVPRGSSVPFIINDTSGYLRTIPGTFLNPTTSGMLQLILMNSLYGAFANRSEFFDACKCWGHKMNIVIWFCSLCLYISGAYISIVTGRGLYFFIFFALAWFVAYRTKNEIDGERHDKNKWYCRYD